MSTTRGMGSSPYGSLQVVLPYGLIWACSHHGATFVPESIPLPPQIKERVRRKQHPFYGKTLGTSSTILDWLEHSHNSGSRIGKSCVPEERVELEIRLWPFLGSAMCHTSVWVRVSISHRKNLNYARLINICGIDELIVENLLCLTLWSLLFCPSNKPQLLSSFVLLHILLGLKDLIWGKPNKQWL